MTVKDIYRQFNQTSGANDAVWVHRDKASDRPRFSSLDSDLKTNVCIIGAGISGISTAYELVSRGKDVILLEAREVLSGETGRTSGHLSNALDDHYINIRKKHGDNGAKAAAESHTWAIGHVGSIAEKLEIECEYRRVPGYEISQFQRGDKGHDADIGELRKEADFAQELGLDVKFDGDLTIQGWDGKPDQRGGVAFANQAAFHPTLYLSGILRWLLKQPNFKGFANTRVVSVEEQGNAKVKVQTQNDHAVECDYAVEATCIPLQKLSVVAEMAYMRTYAVAIRVPKGTVEDCFIYDSADAYKYTRLTACDDKDDYIIVGGGDHEVGQENPTGRFEELEAWVRERFTQAGSVDYRWSGQVNEPMDYMAFIGINQGCDRVFVVTGDSGNGLTHGVIAGRLIADEIEGIANPPWAELYSPKRLASIAKSAPSMIKHAVQINTQYKHIAQPDITDIEDLVADSGGVMKESPLNPIAVYKDENGNITKMSALCPHLKGVVCWNAVEKSFDCPVHGSRFSPTGLCVNGPAKSNLTPVQ